MLHQNSMMSYQQQRDKGSLESYRYKVWSYIQGGICRVTDREVMEALKEPDVNNIRPEITRLLEDGLLIECGKRKCSVTGKTVRVTKASGREYFARGNKPQAKPVCYRGCYND